MNDIPLIPGFIYDVQIDGNPETVKAMCLMDPTDPGDPCWWIYNPDGGWGIHLLQPAFRVKAVSVDREHVQRLLDRALKDGWT